PAPAPEPEHDEAPAEPAGEAASTPVAAPVSSPSLRRMAREFGLDLGKVRGTGPGGRIERSDVRAYIQQLEKAAAKGKAAPADSVAVAPAKPAAEQIDFSKWGTVTRKPLTPLRQ